MDQDLVESLSLSGKALDALRSFSEIGVFGSWPTESAAHAIRFVTWCRQPDTRRMTAIVSSRLGRELDRKDAFFRVLRIACSQLDPQKQVLLSTAGTATHRYVARAAELFGLDLCQLVIARPDQEFDHWMIWLGTAVDQHETGTVFVSPPIGEPTPSQAVRDELMIHQADQILAIHMRRGGNIESLLAARLAARRPGNVFLALGAGELVSRAVADPLMAAGAIGWYVRPCDADAPLPAFLRSGRVIYDADLGTITVA